MGFVKGTDGLAKTIRDTKDPTQDQAGSNITNIINNLQNGTGFSFSGPYSNDATAGAAGVAIGQVYFNNSGGLVVRQT